MAQMLLSHSVVIEEEFSVKGYLYLPGKDQIAHDILAYLAEHPEAEDTLDGIVQWWLLDLKIVYQMNVVKEVLDELVEKGSLVKHRTLDSQIRYRRMKNELEDTRAEA